MATTVAASEQSSTSNSACVTIQEFTPTKLFYVPKNSYQGVIVIIYATQRASTAHKRRADADNSSRPPLCTEYSYYNPLISPREDKLQTSALAIDNPG